MDRYCCNKGLAWWSNHTENRNTKQEFTRLPRSLFGGEYLQVFAERLTDYYNGKLGKAPDKGKFLDVGGKHAPPPPNYCLYFLAHFSF